MRKSVKKTRVCVSKEMHKLSTKAKRKKYPTQKQRVAISLSVCGASRKTKKKK